MRGHSPHQLFFTGDPEILVELILRYNLTAGEAHAGTSRAFHEVLNFDASAITPVTNQATAAHQRNQTIRTSDSIDRLIGSPPQFRFHQIPEASRRSARAARPT
jgi:hypothetical protein